MIALGEAIYFSVPMLVQTAGNVVRDPDVQGRAVFVRENVHPIVVVSHATEGVRDVSLRST